MLPLIEKKTFPLLGECGEGKPLGLQSAMCRARKLNGNFLSEGNKLDCCSVFTSRQYGAGVKVFVELLNAVTVSRCLTGKRAGFFKNVVKKCCLKCDELCQM